MKTHIFNNSVPVEEAAPGIRRQIMAHDTHLMLVRVHFDGGAIAARHAHPHQQITCVESGVFEVEINGVKEVLHPGDCFIIPSDQMHGAQCLEAGVLIDTFSPARLDFLTK